jgi:hypothetical protein
VFKPQLSCGGGGPDPSGGVAHASSGGAHPSSKGLGASGVGVALSLAVWVPESAGPPGSGFDRDVEGEPAGLHAASVSATIARRASRFSILRIAPATRETATSAAFPEARLPTLRLDYTGSIEDGAMTPKESTVLSWKRLDSQCRPKIAAIVLTTVPAALSSIRRGATSVLRVGDRVGLRSSDLSRRVFARDAISPRLTKRFHRLQRERRVDFRVRRVALSSARARIV